MKLYRVFLWRPDAKAGSRGHALHVPREHQGDGRIDNPESYAVLYAADSGAGAFAEAFGRLSVWRDAMLTTMTGASAAIAEYELDRGPVCDLDDPEELVERDLRPSSIVSPERERTQGWARAIFDERRYIGARWWSRHDSRWSVVGLWQTKGLRVTRVAGLHREHQAATEAAVMLDRTWI